MNMSVKLGGSLGSGFSFSLISCPPDSTSSGLGTSPGRKNPGQDLIFVLPAGQDLIFVLPAGQDLIFVLPAGSYQNSHNYQLAISQKT